MSEMEGVIKYHLNHQHKPLPTNINLNPLNAWRCVLYQLQLIGQNPEKYDGLGYGNISQRLALNSSAFVISGTQTGHLAKLSLNDYALIDSASVERNQINSSGLTAPSSEALTHASVYQHDATAQAVIHVHSPQIWRQTLALNLPHTKAEIAYGTTEMAQAVKALMNSEQSNQLPLFTMLGHEDGIVAWGTTLEQAAAVLIQQLANAMALEPVGYIPCTKPKG
ncbi:MAG: class II aldolase/adducin family protein [Methylomonas sp.]